MLHNNPNPNPKRIEFDSIDTMLSLQIRLSHSFSSLSPSCLFEFKMHPAFSSPQHSTHNDFSDKENTIPHVNFSQASMKENIDNNTLFVESAFIPPPPGRVIFCKARGMNLDHVGNNAVLTFDTGFDFVHGAELKCSHAVCRRDGVKFRYCKHCDKGKVRLFFFETTRNE